MKYCKGEFFECVFVGLRAWCEKQNASTSRRARTEIVEYITRVTRARYSMLYYSKHAGAVRTKKKSKEVKITCDAQRNEHLKDLQMGEKKHIIRRDKKFCVRLCTYIHLVMR